jgi:hypothetical protein
LFFLFVDDFAEDTELPLGGKTSADDSLIRVIPPNSVLGIASGPGEIEIFILDVVAIFLDVVGLGFGLASPIV